ncbi:MAG: hypothetical protein MJE68_02595 [Proteobacteria bacterium]|nr:hypothetical protein [Pseudomonadota bacterium]
MSTAEKGGAYFREDMVYEFFITLILYMEQITTFQLSEKCAFFNIEIIFVHALY